MRRLNARFNPKSDSLFFSLNKMQVIFPCYHHSYCSVWRKVSVVKHKCSLKAIPYFFCDLFSLFLKHTREKERERERGWWGPPQSLGFFLHRYETILKNQRGSGKDIQVLQQSEKGLIRDIMSWSRGYKCFPRAATLAWRTLFHVDSAKLTSTPAFTCIKWVRCHVTGKYTGI